MSKPAFRLNRGEEYLRQLSRDTILEIGRYYAGKRKGNRRGGDYAIGWRRREAKEWKITPDFTF